ncbi:SGNH/GDSL hydrolase family protein [Mediterraneibacter massiliensis]|uniref:SGNH/GDSL hydrolase family protein n=1 Tax=Mediterraneibacter massiliensis TaxID=1720300 RepID=UPI0024ACEF36|nr:SGNH/GDSL hydrolase family protein [Mediterraneibacter massiliensis]
MIFDNMLFHNVKELVKEADGYRICRMPERVRKNLDVAGQFLGQCTPGVEIRFFMVSDQVRLYLRRGHDDMMKDPNTSGKIPDGLVEVYQGDSPKIGRQSSIIITDRCTEIVINKQKQRNPLWNNRNRFADGLIRVIVPYDWKFYYCGVEGKVRPPEEKDMPQKRLLAYGSSITQGGNAVAPSQTYAMVLAELLEMDLINMGMAGSCRIEPAMIDYISGIPAEAIILELGVNVLEVYSENLFEDRVRHLLISMKKSHPGIPIVCTDIFPCYLYRTMQEKRKKFSQIVRKCIEECDVRMTYLPGEDAFYGNQYLSCDYIHPSVTGHMRIAEYFYQAFINNGFRG